VLDKAVEAAGYKRMAPILTRDSLLRNFDIAEKLGCLGARRKSFSKGKIPDSLIFNGHFRLRRLA